MISSTIFDFRSRFASRSGVLALAALCAGQLSSPVAEARYAYVPAATIPESALIRPVALVATLGDSPDRMPLILQVGARVLYVQAHVPGSEYVGPGEEDEGIEALRARVAKLPHATPIVIYCGCCPWDHCRNIGGAYTALQRLGFTAVKVLYLESDFGSNWVDRGYPVARGE